MKRQIPVQIFTDAKKGSICFEYLSNFSYNRREQEILVARLAEKYKMSTYEIRQIIKEIK